MRTAMQELMQWMEKNEFMVNKGFIEKINECLEKEKEQIMKANMDGYKEGCTYLSFDHRPKTTEEYYNQTYNQTYNL